MGKNEKIMEAIEELSRALRDRHQVLCKTARFAEEHHDTTLQMYDQARVMVAHYIDMLDRISEAARTTTKEPK